MNNNQYHFLLGGDLSGFRGSTSSRQVAAFFAL
jgi:hypothetical protein